MTSYHKVPTSATAPAAATTSALPKIAKAPTASTAASTTMTPIQTTSIGRGHSVTSMAGIIPQLMTGPTHSVHPATIPPPSSPILSPSLSEVASAATSERGTPSPFPVTPSVSVESSGVPATAMATSDKPFVHTPYALTPEKQTSATTPAGHWDADEVLMNTRRLTWPLGCDPDAPEKPLEKRAQSFPADQKSKNKGKAVVVAPSEEEDPRDAVTPITPTTAQPHDVDHHEDHSNPTTHPYASSLNAAAGSAMLSAQTGAATSGADPVLLRVFEDIDRLTPNSKFDSSIYSLFQLLSMSKDDKAFSKVAEILFTKAVYGPESEMLFWVEMCVHLYAWAPFRKRVFIRFEFLRLLTKEDTQIIDNDYDNEPEIRARRLKAVSFCGQLFNYGVLPQTGVAAIVTTKVRMAQRMQFFKEACFSIDSLVTFLSVVGKHLDSQDPLYLDNVFSDLLSVATRLTDNERRQIFGLIGHRESWRQESSQ